MGVVVYPGDLWRRLTPRLLRLPEDGWVFRFRRVYHWGETDKFSHTPNETGIWFDVAIRENDAEAALEGALPVAAERARGDVELVNARRADKRDFRSGGLIALGPIRHYGIHIGQESENFLNLIRRLRKR